MEIWLNMYFVTEKPCCDMHVFYMFQCMHSCFGKVQINYCQAFNIRCTLVGNKILDYSDVVGASPAGAAPTASSFLT